MGVLMSNKPGIPALDNLLEELCSSLTAASNYVLAARRMCEDIAGAENVPLPLDKAIDQMRRAARAYHGFNTLLDRPETDGSTFQERDHNDDGHTRIKEEMQVLP